MAILHKVELGLACREVEQVVRVVGRHEEGVAARNQELGRVQDHGHLTLHHHEHQGVLFRRSEAFLCRCSKSDEGGAMVRGGQKACILDGFRPFEEILKHFEKKIHQ